MECLTSCLKSGNGERFDILAGPFMAILKCSIVCWRCTNRYIGTLCKSNSITWTGDMRPLTMPTGKRQWETTPTPNTCTENWQSATSCGCHGAFIGRKAGQRYARCVGSDETETSGRQRCGMAFRFAGSFPKVLTVLSGMTYKEHVQDNLRTFSPLVPLSEAEQDFLQDVAERMKDSQNIPCTDCKYCMPCPYGIDIPANFLHYNKCVNHGYVSKSHLMPTMRSPESFSDWL